jgi:hypothetical protein
MHKIINYKSRNKLSMKVKLGITDSVRTFLVYVISAIAAVPPAMMTATFFNLERHVGLYVQVELNQFQHFL